MPRLIDKSALVAEIEKRRNKNARNKLNLAASFEDNYLLSFINTLEVKEVKESTDAFIEKACDYLNSQLYDWVSITNPDQRSCANVIPKKDFIEDFRNYMKGE